MPLLPSESEAEPPEGEPRVVGVDDDDAERLLSALSAETARDIFSELHDSPRTASELADSVDTSLQNAQYHLGKLEEADLVEVHDTRYSEKGREMNVYAPSAAPLVLFAGGKTESDTIRSMLETVLGAVGVLGLASVLVQYVFGDGLRAPTGSGTGGGQAGGEFAATDAQATQTAAEGGYNVAVKATTTAATAADGGLGLPPGLVFFLGGLLVVTVVGVVWAIRR